MQDIRPQLRRYTAWLCTLGMNYFMVKLLWMQYQSGWESFNYGILLLVLALLALTIAVALNRPLALRIAATFSLCYAITSGFVAATMLSFDGVSLEFFYALLKVPLAGAAAYLLDYRSAEEKANQRARQEQDGKALWGRIFSWDITLLIIFYLFWVALNPLHDSFPFFFQGMLRLLTLFLIGLMLTQLITGFLAWRHQRPIAAHRAGQLALILAAILLTLWRFHTIEQQAIAYLTEKANQLQQQCDQQRTCPARIEGWKQGRIYEFKASDGTRFQMYYYPQQNQFRIYIDYDLGEGYFLHGGVGQPVTRAANNE